jgi:hypothetical protein
VEWINVDSTRVMYQHNDFIVVKPVAVSDSIPLFCQVCGCTNLTIDDVLAYREHGCCSTCVMHWVVVHRSEWDAGWRPSQADIDHDVRRRRSRPIQLPF